MQSQEDQINIQFPQENIDNFLQDQTNLFEGRWEFEEHHKFLHSIIQYGKDWKKVQDAVQTRTSTQIRSHAQKYFLKIKKIVKDRKKLKGKKMPDSTQAQQQLKFYFSQYPLTENTPQQVIDLIRIQKIGIKKLLQVKSQGNMKFDIKKILLPNKSIASKKKQKCDKNQNQQKRNKQITQIQGGKYQKDLSFYMWLIRKNHQHFANGGMIMGLIDFGRDQQQKTNCCKQETSNNRKDSFRKFFEIQCQYS